MQSSLLDLVDEYTSITGRPKFTLSVSEYLALKEAALCVHNNNDANIIECQNNFGTNSATNDKPINNMAQIVTPAENRTSKQTSSDKITSIQSSKANPIPKSTQIDNKPNNKNSILSLMKSVQG